MIFSTWFRASGTSSSTLQTLLRTTGKPTRVFKDLLKDYQNILSDVLNFLKDLSNLPRDPREYSIQNPAVWLALKSSIVQINNLKVIYTARNHSNKAYLDGGGVGHADLLLVIGEEAGSRGRDLPGTGGGLGVEVSQLTCQEHERHVTSPASQTPVRIHLKPAATVALRLKVHHRKPALQAGGVTFERHGCWTTREGLMEYTVQLHYGKCRNQCFWHISDFRSGYFDHFSFLIWLSQVQLFHGTGVTGGGRVYCD